MPTRQRGKPGARASPSIGTAPAPASRKHSDDHEGDGVSGNATEYVFDTRHHRYPVAAHLILRDPAGKILLMRRAGSEYGEGHLAFPAGHVDLGETPTASIIREAYEELGITIAPASLAPAG